MNARTIQEPTPEGRIASAAVEEMRLFVQTWQRLPDVADLREVLKVHVEREILDGKLSGLRVPREQCDAEIRNVIMEIASKV